MRKLRAPTLSTARLLIVALLALPCAAASTRLTPISVPHGPVDKFKWVALPEFGGSEAIIYRSPDGKRVAAAFRESGTFSFRYPFDELLIVTSGTATFRVRGGPTFALKKGEIAYFREGLVVDMTLSKDFSDITMLMGDRPVAWR